jgi:nitrate/TMAO reductase-like tetraheme cytochrome c subunit
MDDPASRNAPDTPNPAEPGQTPAPQSVAKTPRHWIRKLLLGIGILVVFVAITMGAAEYWTAQPAFCRSCHIMEPYWQSWSHDIHGEKLGVRCVDCHYAPGERFTFHAKFKGLSQATSYFSGRAGGSRPRAHVNDASCLTSGCHGDHEYLDKKLLIGEVRTEERIIGETVTRVQRAPTVTFVHSTHLGIDRKLADTQDQIEDLTARIKKEAPAELLAFVEQVAASVQPRAEQTEKLKAELDTRGLPKLLEPAIELVRLHDMLGRLTQLAGLTCASCHGYDASGGDHFTVDLQTCYTCHFTNQTFNAETGQCLNCHAPPSRQIVVHGVPTAEGATPSIMDHQDILDRNIDCASCHLDVVQGRSQVTARDCTHCHDRASYMKDFENRTIETVKEYHRVHVAAQRARCPDCHHAVAHELIEPTLVTTSAGFVKPILDECQHCHPDHHREQVELLMGVGGEGIEQPMPNAMFGSRVNCRACHTEPGTDFKGTPLIAATAETCIACHEEKYGDLLQQWLGEISSYLGESEKAMELVRKRIEDHRAAGKPIPQRADELVGMAAHNLHLVRIGNGIHNKNYAAHLMDVSDDYLREAMDLLTRPATATATAPAGE